MQHEFTSREIEKQSQQWKEWIFAHALMAEATAMIDSASPVANVQKMP